MWLQVVFLTRTNYRRSRLYIFCMCINLLSDKNLLKIDVLTLEWLSIYYAPVLSSWQISIRIDLTDTDHWAVVFLWYILNIPHYLVYLLLYATFRSSLSEYSQRWSMFYCYFWSLLIVIWHAAPGYLPLVFINFPSRYPVVGMHPATFSKHVAAHSTDFSTTNPFFTFRILRQNFTIQTSVML